jgi:hypothetical protein
VLKVSHFSFSRESARTKHHQRYSEQKANIQQTRSEVNALSTDEFPGIDSNREFIKRFSEKCPSVSLNTISLSYIVQFRKGIGIAKVVYPNRSATHVKYGGRLNRFAQRRQPIFAVLEKQKLELSPFLEYGFAVRAIHLFF